MTARLRSRSFPGMAADAADAALEADPFGPASGAVVEGAGQCAISLTALPIVSGDAARR